MDIEEFLNITLRPGSSSGTYCHPIVSLTTCRKSDFVWSFQICVQFIGQCGLFLLPTKCELFLVSKDVCWSSGGLCGKKVSYPPPKYCSLLFYIFASVELLPLQLLFLQINCKGEIGSLSETSSVCHRIFPSRKGQVPQSVLRATIAKQFRHCVSCSFLLSTEPEPCGGMAVDE